MSKLTQNKAIQNHLEKHGNITSLEAINLYGATRLSGVIHTLRHKQGLSIKSVREPKKTRYGNVAPCVRYVLNQQGVGQ